MCECWQNIHKCWKAVDWTRKEWGGNVDLVWIECWENVDLIWIECWVDMDNMLRERWFKMAMMLI